MEIIVVACPECGADVDMDTSLMIDGDEVECLECGFTTNVQGWREISQEAEEGPDDDGE